MNEALVTRCGPNEYYLDCYGPLNGFCVADEESLSRAQKSTPLFTALARAKPGALLTKESCEFVLSAMHATDCDRAMPRSS